VASLVVPATGTDTKAAKWHWGLDLRIKWKKNANPRQQNIIDKQGMEIRRSKKHTSNKTIDSREADVRIVTVKN